MDSCLDRIYSEEYQEFLVEYGAIPSQIPEYFGTDCYQIISARFAVVYTEGGRTTNGQYAMDKVVPNCYGLMSSEAVLDAAGITRVERQPNLDLNGREVMMGFIDTGDGV